MMENINGAVVLALGLLTIGEIVIGCMLASMLDHLHDLQEHVDDLEHRLCDMIDSHE